MPSIYSSARTELAKLLIYGLFRKTRVLAQDGQETSLTCGMVSSLASDTCDPQKKKTGQKHPTTSRSKPRNQRRIDFLRSTASLAAP